MRVGKGANSDILLVAGTQHSADRIQPSRLLADRLEKLVRAECRVLGSHLIRDCGEGRNFRGCGKRP